MIPFFSDVVDLLLSSIVDAIAIAAVFFFGFGLSAVMLAQWLASRFGQRLHPAIVRALSDRPDRDHPESIDPMLDPVDQP